MPWRVGTPREQGHWGPTSDVGVCVSRGMCRNCSQKVFGWADGKPVVARYERDIVGCPTRGNLGRANAIAFLPRQRLRAVYREHKISSKVRRIKEGKIPQGHGSKQRRCVVPWRLEASPAAQMRGQI